MCVCGGAYFSADMQLVYSTVPADMVERKSFELYIYIYIYIYYHHDNMLLAQVSLTLSRHSSLLSIVPGRSSRLHPASVWRCCREVLAGCPTLACLCKGVHWSSSLMGSSLLFQLCPACDVYLIWMVFKMGGWWPCSCCFIGCRLQDSFNTAHSILVQLLTSFLSVSMWCIHIVVLTLPFLGKNCILFYHIGLSFLVDETLLSR